ncbi:hypothetical protein [Rhizobium skierniewicense]|uniref:hypothetical protein n=1 Tax=Rhizobium skierniewicense TaxID=984260 RepID=UPI0015748487|nr:hypothetical protein [Rhizobium skierniewicense]NTF31404.1 hypothetical protein [Rhizobium skierniewicense]
MLCLTALEMWWTLAGNLPRARKIIPQTLGFDILKIALTLKGSNLALTIAEKEMLFPFCAQPTQSVRVWDFDHDIKTEDRE